MKKEVKGEWIWCCPVCLGGDFTINTETVEAIVCANCGAWFNELNNRWYLSDGTKLPQAGAGNRWLIKE